MKVFFDAPKHMSRAMFRCVDALERYRPEHVVRAKTAEEADLCILHVIGDGLMLLRELRPKRFVVLQYCGLVEPSGRNDERRAALDALWARAEGVWSYFDLAERVGSTPFARSPLGIDAAFLQAGIALGERPYLALTSGYVSGPRAEAIEEVAAAAVALDQQVVHLGPASVVGMEATPQRKHWVPVSGVSDGTLATLYQQAKWVSGLRHDEGYEMPVTEGLVCGARPIVFDRPEMRDWYEGHAVFVPECSGPELESYLLSEVFDKDPEPVSDEERAAVRDRFTWKAFGDAVWGLVKE